MLKTLEEDFFLIVFKRQGSNISRGLEGESMRCAISSISIMYNNISTYFTNRALKESRKKKITPSLSSFHVVFLFTSLSSFIFKPFHNFISKEPNILNSEFCFSFFSFSLFFSQAKKVSKKKIYYQAYLLEESLTRSWVSRA